MATKFGGLTDQSDPLLGNRTFVNGCLATDTFSFPQESGLSRRLTGMPRFISVRGGAYFFLPSRRALRYIASRYLPTNPAATGTRRPASAAAISSDVSASGRR